MDSHEILPLLRPGQAVHRLLHRPSHLHRQDQFLQTLWRPINRGPWRFAYDDQAERSFVERVMQMLRAESPKRKRVYVLIGNEPVASCLERLREVIAWGGEPHAQPYIKLNALERVPHVRFDWTAQTLTDMARWANRRIWRYAPYEEYRASTRSKRNAA